MKQLVPLAHREPEERQAISGDRRRRRQWVPFDMRSQRERRRGDRRDLASPGRREHPHPIGIDEWA